MHLAGQLKGFAHIQSAKRSIFQPFVYVFYGLGRVLFLFIHILEHSGNTDLRLSNILHAVLRGNNSIITSDTVWNASVECVCLFAMMRSEGSEK
jgi:hypothetical protein